MTKQSKSWLLEEDTLALQKAGGASTDSINHAPVVNNEWVTIRGGASVSAPESILLANDSDPDGDALSITSYGNPSHGTLTRAVDGTLTYTPTAGYSGADSFTYMVTDTHGACVNGTVYFTVLPAFCPPVITQVIDDVGPVQGNVPSGGTTDDTLPLIKGTADPGSKVEVFDNGVKIGETTALPDGTWSLPATTPIPAGTNTLTAVSTAPDGNHGTSNPYVLNCVPGGGGNNLAPIAGDDYVSLPTGTSISGNESVLLANDRDPEGGPLAITSYGQPANGTLTRAADGTLTYTPKAGFVGTDTFTYTIADNKGATDVGQVFLTVTGPVATPPVITSLIDDVGPVQGNVPDGGTTDDTLPLIKGTATPNAVVKVFDNGVPIGTTTSAPDGTWSLPVTAPLGAGPHAFTATATGPDGATLPTATPYDCIVVPPVQLAAPTVTITEDANNDGVISRAELNGRIDVQVGLPNTAKVGDTVSVMDNLGNVTGKLLNAADIAAGRVNLPDAFPAPAEGGTITVTAKIVDAAGMSSPTATDSAVLDTTGPVAPTVTITTDTNNDGTINQAELNAHGGLIDVSVGLPFNAQPGDKLTVTDQAGHQIDKVLTPADISAGTVTLPGAFPPPADGQPVVVTAKVTDPVGNASPNATDNATLHTSAPTPTVTLTDDKNNDGVITRPELAGQTRVDVRVDLPAGAVPGALLQIHDNAGNGSSKVLTPADIAAGHVDFNDVFPLPAPGGTVAVGAKLTDPNGNVSPEATDAAVFNGNYAPVATDDANSLRLGGGFPQAQGNLLSNDSDPDGSPAQLQVAGVANNPNVTPGAGVGGVIEGTFGHLSVNPDGSYTYVADKAAGLIAPVSDVFYYVDKDAGNANSNVAKLTIQVDPALAGVVAVSSPQVTEGADLLFTVTTTAAAAATTVTLDLAGITATLGTDTGAAQVNFGAGWQALVGNSVLLPANSSSFQVKVPTTADAIVEMTETLSLKASSQNGTSATGIGTILDDDLSGRATGTEDTPLALTWANFNLQNVPGVQPKVTVESLPVDGTLQYNSNGSWNPVGVGQEISKADIDAGKLRFVPDANESGIDAYHVPGVGNKLNDYANFHFGVVGPNGEAFHNGTMTIDIAPKADGGQTVTMNALEDIVQGGSRPPFLAPVTGWTKISFSLSGATPDTDGSERSLVALTNMRDYYNEPLTVYTVAGVVIPPGDNGAVWLDPSQQYYISSPQQAGRYGDYTLYRQEVNLEGQVLDQVASPVKQFDYTSPLVLDLNGDGVQTTSVDNGVYFDLQNDGTATKTGWADSHDGLLVRDLNGNGTIDNGSELFGDHTALAHGGKAADGFTALADLDANHDGVVNAKDAGFAQLQVWQDANGDGITQAGELHSLGSLGIVALNLAPAQTNTVQNGNIIGLVSSYATADGATHEMADVWFYGNGEAKPAESLAAADLLDNGSQHNVDTLMGGAPAPQVASATAATAAVPTAAHEALAQHDFAVHTSRFEPVLEQHSMA